MDFHLDALLNLPHATVEQCDQEQNSIILTLGLLNEAADCPHCGSSSDELNQSRSVMLRDLSVFGQATHLKVPRRQFYCRPCQQYFTERLPYVGSSGFMVISFSNQRSTLIDADESFRSS